MLLADFLLSSGAVARDDEFRSTIRPRVPIVDERLFDADLRSIFGSEGDDDLAAGDFIRRHLRELIGRVGYWSGVDPQTVRAFLEHLAQRADLLGLRVAGLEPSTLIELTAFGTAVMMKYRYTDQLGLRREAS